MQSFQKDHRVVGISFDVGQIRTGKAMLIRCTRSMMRAKHDMNKKGKKAKNNRIERLSCTACV